MPDPNLALATMVGQTIEAARLEEADGHAELLTISFVGGGSIAIRSHDGYDHESWLTMEVDAGPRGGP